MGPNALWLVEWLTSSMRLEPGMRVLDLGCGKAMTSVFLAKEFGAKVWAVDLWIGPDNNFKRARDMGVADLVCPVKAEAHALPFAHGFFDAIVSVDSYQYFGTDQLYLGYPDSAAARGLPTETTTPTYAPPSNRRPKRPDRAVTGGVRTPRPVKRLLRLVPGVHW